MPLDRTVFNTWVDDTGLDADGTILHKNDIKTGILDPIDAVVGDWTPYTPVWAASGTAAFLGNATLLGRYLKINKIVFVDVALTMGSTTTYGTGTYTLTLPLPALDANGQTGAVFLYHLASTTSYGGSLFVAASTIFGVWSDGAGQIGPAIPFTWAAGDQLRASFFYVAA